MLLPIATNRDNGVSSSFLSYATRLCVCVLPAWVAHGKDIYFFVSFAHSSSSLRILHNIFCSCISCCVSGGKGLSRRDVARDVERRKKDEVCVRCVCKLCVTMESASRCKTRGVRFAVKLRRKMETQHAFGESELHRCRTWVVIYDIAAQTILTSNGMGFAIFISGIYFVAGNNKKT